MLALPRVWRTYFMGIVFDSVDVEDVDVDVDVFVDDHYVCSSVAGLLCSTSKARYPDNCGVTAPL